MSFSDFSYPHSQQDQDQRRSINVILWKMESRALDILEEPSHLVKVFAYFSLFELTRGKDHLTVSFEQQSWLC